MLFRVLISLMINTLFAWRTTKITRRDSLVDYLKGKIYFDLERPDVELIVDMLDSKKSRFISSCRFYCKLCTSLLYI